MTIPQHRPSIKRKDMDAVLSCMVTDTLGPGSSTQTFVSELAKSIGCAGGVALRDYARAIDLVCSVLELGERSTVVLSPLLPAVYHHVLTARGVYPVYVDVTEDAPVLDVAQLSGVETPDALFVHTPLGYCAELSGLEENGMAVVEDCSLGLGGSRNGRPVGSFGRFAIVAFEPQHIITTGGGAAAFAKSSRQRTALRAAAAALPPGCYMPDMNGALGVTQLKELSRFVERRQELEKRFADALQRTRHSRPVSAEEVEGVPSGFAVLLESSGTEIVAYAKKHGVEVSYAFSGSIYAADAAVQSLNLPNAARFYLRCLQFPLYPSLSKSEVESIQKVLSTLP